MFYKREIINAIISEWDPLIWVSESEFVNYAFGLFQRQENSNAQQFALITICNAIISSDPNEVKNMMRSNALYLVLN